MALTRPWRKDAALHLPPLTLPKPATPLIKCPLLEDVGTRLGALSVLRARGAGDSDPAYDLAIR
jgi:hypothetical protein